MASRFFISHRFVDRDVKVAKQLHGGLEARGHEVFLDASSLKPGQAWAERIDDALSAADVMVLLLSKHIADKPDMVTEEVAMARRLLAEHGRPKIVPIRLDADVMDTLPYDLRAQVSRIQHAFWKGPGDTERLVAMLHDVVESTDAPMGDSKAVAGAVSLGVDDLDDDDLRASYLADDDDPPRGPIPASPGRRRGGSLGMSRADADPVRSPSRGPTRGGADRNLQPPKVGSSEGWFVARGPAERQAANRLVQSGSPVVLVGPTEIGKTYLLDHLLDFHRKDGDEAVRINLEYAASDAGDEVDELIYLVGLAMVDELNLDEAALERAWERKRPPAQKLTRFVERTVLPAVEGRLFLIVDRADSVIQLSQVSKLFLMLRRWAELERNGWDRLRMLLAISTEPSLLQETIHESPFNITDPIRLGDFEAEQVAELASLHGLRWSASQVGRLMSKVGGHPYLARKVMYRSALAGQPLDELLPGLTSDNGPLADHLRSRLLRVNRDPELRDAIVRLVNRDQEPVDLEVAERLERAGLIRRENGRLELRYPLYRDYFGTWLKPS